MTMIQNAVDCPQLRSEFRACELYRSFEKPQYRSEGLQQDLMSDKPQNPWSALWAHAVAVWCSGRTFNGFRVPLRAK